jgi:hypothetical protein
MVYITRNSIPQYSIGPWVNPNKPKLQNKTIKFYLTPSYSNLKTASWAGIIGFSLDGVALYNVGDGMSWNSLGWHFFSI